MTTGYRDRFVEVASRYAKIRPKGKVVAGERPVCRCGNVIFAVGVRDGPDIFYRRRDAIVWCNAGIKAPEFGPAMRAVGGVGKATRRPLVATVIEAICILGEPAIVASSATFIIRTTGALDVR